MTVEFSLPREDGAVYSHVLCLTVGRAFAAGDSQIQVGLSAFRLVAERGGKAFFLQDLGGAVFRVLVDVFVAHDVYGSRQTDRSHAGNLFLRDGINGVHLVGIQRRCAGHA